jgi:hypothetical protein
MTILAVIGAGPGEDRGPGGRIMASIAVSRPLFQHVSWGALFAGFFVGFGAWLLLLALGAGIGLAAFDPKDLGNWQGLGIGFGIWGVVAGIVALFVAGWLAARLSAAATDRTEGMFHGVVLWGFMLVVGLWIASMALGTAVGGAASAAGAAAEAADGGAAGAQATQEAQGALQQAQQEPGQTAQQAARAGRTGAWAFFLYGALTLVAAALGGRLGVPKDRLLRAREEAAPLPERPLSPQRA